MTLPILLAFCASSDRERVSAAADAISIYALFTEVGRCMAREGSRPLVLLAIGPEGGASLARWVEVYGLDGVAGIGLLGVTAPWAERIQRVDSRHAQWPCALPLGPLEPLRKVAERARVGEPCPCEHHPDPNRVCASCINRHIHSLRIVIACAPNDGPCKCLDMGGPRIPWDDCGLCDGTGKVLSSAEVAYELTGINADGSPDSGLPPRIDRGGVTVRSYETRAALTDHGLRTVIETLTR